MLCNICMKEVDWSITVKHHERDHPMTYAHTKEICLGCFTELLPKRKSKTLEKVLEEKENG